MDLVLAYGYFYILQLYIFFSHDRPTTGKRPPYPYLQSLLKLFSEPETCFGFWFQRSKPVSGMQSNYHNSYGVDMDNKGF